MARIASVVIPSEKQVWIALTYVFGIGRTTSKAILAEAKIEPTTRVKRKGKAIAVGGTQPKAASKT